MGRSLSLLLAGALGGLLSWLIMEPFAPRTLNEQPWATYEPRLAMVTGLLIGLLVGGMSGRWQGSRRHAVIGASAGAVLGAIMGPIGISLGSTIYNTIGGGTRGLPGISLTTEILGRAAGWGIFGAFLGIAEGAVGRNVKRAFQGMIGGLLGGGIGGAAFSISGMILGAATVTIQGSNETGTIPRAIGLVCTGAGIGLLIGIVEALSRQAWVRLELGRNEGREWPVDAAQTFIGRDERAHIPIFSDPSIAAHHATIVCSGGRYFLHDAGSPIGVGLNGAKISQAELASGDVIQLGTTNLKFLLRGGQMRRISAPEARPVAVPIGGVAQATPVHAQTTMGQPNAPTQAFVPATSGAFAVIATTGPLTGQRFAITGAVEIGREASGIPLSFDTGVSRRHATLTPGTDGIFVTDLGSTNGTTVNGAKVGQTVARSGDRIQIGQTIFQVV